MTPAVEKVQRVDLDILNLEYAWEIGGEIYVVANLLIPAWWFTKGKRRYGSNSVGQE